MPNVVPIGVVANREFAIRSEGNSLYARDLCAASAPSRGGDHTESSPGKLPQNSPKNATPLDGILGLYVESGSQRSFAEDLAAHLRHGVVVSTAEVLVLARPVASGAAVGLINDPGHVFPASDCDAWYVYAFAGNLRAALEYFPYRLPYIAFERVNQNGLRFLPLDRFVRKCRGLEAARKNKK